MWKVVLPETLEGRVKPVGDLMILGQEKLQAVESNPLAGQSANSMINTANTANKTTNVSVGSVNVDASGGDPNVIGNKVAGALTEQMKQTVGNFDDGVFT